MSHYRCFALFYVNRLLPDVPGVSLMHRERGVTTWLKKWFPSRLLAAWSVYWTVWSVHPVWFDCCVELRLAQIGSLEVSVDLLCPGSDFGLLREVRSGSRADARD